MHLDDSKSNSDPARLARAATRTLLAIGIAFGALLAAGCSDDDGPPSFIITTPCMEFAAAPETAMVAAQPGESSTCDLVEVDLVVSGVTDVFGARFKVVYPIGITQFIPPALTDGSFLSTDGTSLLVEAVDDPLGEVTIGVTRVGTGVGGATPATGDDLLVRLRFVRLVSQGTGDIEFDVESLVAPPVDETSAPVEIPNVTWSGGTLTISSI